LIGVEAEYDAIDNLDEDKLHVFLDSELAPGYIAWIVPGINCTQIGLAKQAMAAGAKINLDSAYSGSSFVNSHHHFKKLHLQCRYLVGCDGARSKVAQYYNLGSNRHFLIGVEAEYDAIDNLDEDKLHVFLDSELAPGYIAWIVPGINCTQIGLAN